MLYCVWVINMAIRYDFSEAKSGKSSRHAEKTNKVKRAEAGLKALELRVMGRPEKRQQKRPDSILLRCDGAAWHKDGALEIPENIAMLRIPPYTPEMNPIKQILKEIRKRSFRNEIFPSLNKVLDRLCDTI